MTSIIQSATAIALDEDFDKKYEIIDGQQRITTLTIICLGCLKLLQEWVEADMDVAMNKYRIDKITETYVGFKDGKTGVVRAKLK